jgi:hypothetical protein
MARESAGGVMDDNTNIGSWVNDNPPTIEGLQYIVRHYVKLCDVYRSDYESNLKELKDKDAQLKVAIEALEFYGTCETGFRSSPDMHKIFNDIEFGAVARQALRKIGAGDV